VLRVVTDAVSAEGGALLLAESGGDHPGACPARTVSVRYISKMNDNFGELKGRIRKLNELLSAEPDRILGNLEFARAVSQAQRLVRDGDRTREPSQVLRAAVEKAELLGRAIR